MSPSHSEGPIRLGAECFPPNMYFEHSENGTSWHGSAGFTMLTLIQSWIPQGFEVIYDLSPSNTTYQALQTAAEDRVDIVPDNYGRSYERYQIVDFAYPTVHSGVYIISAKNVLPTGYIFKGIYDIPSYILLYLSFLMMISVLYISFSYFPRQETEGKVSFVLIVLHLFGSIWGQPFPSGMQSRGLSTQTTVYLFVFWNSLIAIMYGSLVISKMTLQREFNPINSLSDLGSKPEIRAYIPKHSFIQDSIDNFQVLQDMKNEERIDLMSINDFADGKVFRNLKKGTHILIESKANFEFYRSKLNDKALYCLNDPSTYHFSKEHLFFSYAGWVFKKKFKYSGTINNHLMWLDAFGLIKNAKRQSGIFSPKVLDYDCNIEGKNQNLCAKYPVPIETHKRLSLLHLHMLFRYLCYGLITAFVSFLAEVAYFYFTRNN